MKLQTCITLTLMAIFAAVTSGGAEETTKKNSVPNALNFKVQSIDGQEVDLVKYQGKVVLVVNVASQ